MRHAGAADGFDEGFLNDAVFHVEGELAGALLRRTPADTVRKAGNVADLLRLDPLAFLRNGRRAMVCTLCNRAHMLYFSRVNHCKNPFHCLLASAGRRKKMTIFPPGSGKSAAKRNSRILTVLYRYSCGMSTWISTGFRTKCRHAARFPRTNSTKVEKTAACAGHAAEWDPKYYWPAPSPP